MNPEVFAPMFVTTVLILTTGGVLVLRPLAKRLGSYLEQATLERQRAQREVPASEQQERTLRLLESMETRLSRLEERVNFTEAVLLSRAQREDAPPALPRDGGA